MGLKGILKCVHLYLGNKKLADRAKSLVYTSVSLTTCFWRAYGVLAEIVKGTGGGHPWEGSATIL